MSKSHGALLWCMFVVVLNLLAIAGFAAPDNGATSQSAPLNILWITCEDMSPDLGCYGAPNADTPNVDSLAAQGTRYTNVFPTAPVCAPSRSALITGAYATTIGTHHMRSKAVPPEWVNCFPEYLRAAGYYCTNNVKTDYNFDVPLTAWDENSRRAHWRNRPAGKPFFSVFNFTDTHEGNFHLPPREVKPGNREMPDHVRHDPAKVQLPPYYPDTPVIRADWARYQDMITVMDLEVGRVLKELEDDGLSSNTIVFFFSDHGRALPRGKRWVYDSGLKVPLIIRHPHQSAGNRVSDQLISFIDFAPTVLTLAGVNVPSTLKGRNFLSTEPLPEHKYIFAARDRIDETVDVIRAVRDKRFKYIRNFEPHKPYAQDIQYGEKTPTLKELRRLHAEGQLTGPQLLFFRPEKPVEELYDTVTDPHEIDDLAKKPEHADTLKKMREALEQWQKDTGDLGLIPESELQEKMRPGGVALEVASPMLVRVVDPATSTAQITMRTETPGASIAWKLAGKGNRWQLYVQPLSVPADSTVIAVACRAGYKNSDEVTISKGVHEGAGPAQN